MSTVELYGIDTDLLVQEFYVALSSLRHQKRKLEIQSESAESIEDRLRYERMLWPVRFAVTEFEGVLVRAMEEDGDGA